MELEQPGPTYLDQLVDLAVIWRRAQLAQRGGHEYSAVVKIFDETFMIVTIEGRGIMILDHDEGRQT